jgi:hypothetical protein
MGGDSKIGDVDGDKLRELLDNLELASRRENQTGIVVAIQVIRNDLKTGRLALALPAPASLDEPKEWRPFRPGDEVVFKTKTIRLNEYGAYEANEYFKVGLSKMKAERCEECAGNGFEEGGATDDRCIHCDGTGRKK